MKTFRFNTVIGDDHVIRPPQGMDLVPGAAEVIVLQHEAPAERAAARMTPLRDRLARAAEQLGIHDLPADLAENHDHYAHGSPKGIDGR